MGQSSDGRLFHVVGPQTEKARPPSFVLVLTVTANLEVDDLSRLLAESDSVNNGEVPTLRWILMVKNVVQWSGHSRVH